jgi:hypothetical protein
VGGKIKSDNFGKFTSSSSSSSSFSHFHFKVHL